MQRLSAIDFNLNPIQFSNEEMELKVGLLAANSDAFYVEDLPTGLKITVAADKLQATDTTLITQIFNLCLSQNLVNKLDVDVCIRKNKPERSIIEFNKENCKISTIKELKNQLINDFHLLNNSILTIGFVRALIENAVPQTWEDWCDALECEIEHINSDLSAIQLSPSLFEHLANNINYFYLLNNESSELISLAFSSFVILAINRNCISELIQINKYIDLLQYTDGKPDYFLHQAILANDLESFEFLLTHIQEIKLYDDEGNTFLHCCSSKEAIARALKFGIDINHQNAQGNTALHTAMIDGDEREVINLLLSYGVNPYILNNKKQTYWAFHSLYKKFEKNGYVLTPAPHTDLQKGPNCGFYSIACALNQQGLFYSARKCDRVPKATFSLRMLRKYLGIESVGGLFTTANLKKVLQAIGCDGDVVDVCDYKHFLRFIEDAMKNNLPVLIPHAYVFKNGRLTKTPKAECAHWVTIIGCITKNVPNDEEKILVANNGAYEKIYAKDLYNACCLIDVNFPKTYFSKSKIKNPNKQNQWKLSPLPIQETDQFRVEVLPELKLDDFRGKLVKLVPASSNDNQIVTGDNANTNRPNAMR